MVFRKVLNIAQLIIAISVILSIVIFAGIEEKLEANINSVEQIQRVDLPEIRIRQAEIEAQFRELKIQMNNFDKMLEKIDSNVEYIRRRLEQ